MNSSTLTSIENKINHLKQNIDKLQTKVSNKEDKTLQLLRINFISFLDESIEKLDQLSNNLPSSFTLYSENQYQKNDKNQAQQFKQRYFQSQKQRTELQKKLTDLLQKQIKEQQHMLKLERSQSQILKEKYKLESQIKQLQQKNQQLHLEINNLSLKIKDQQKQMHRLISLNHKLNDERQILIIQRNRTQKKLNQLIEKYQNDQIVIHTKNMKGIERFSLKNTEGIKITRTLTNISNEKKNNQKYFVLQLPAKIQLQKIVYGIRVGTIMPNKQITYFNQLQLYEKDPMKLTLQGENLAIDYLKRKEKVLIDKVRFTKPQVLILLYGKGDSVMIDQTKEVKN